MSENFNPFLRFSSAMDVSKMNAQKVTIVGAGGIGAPAALALAKTGVRMLRIYDFDKVAEENTGPQMYGPSDIGRYKVEVLKEFLRNQAPWTEVEVIADYFEGQRLDCDVLVSAVDSLPTRRAIFRRAIQASNKPKLIIDPRMGVEVLTVFSVLLGHDDAWYARTLEGDAIEATCTAKATFYTGLVAGAMVSQAVKAWVCGERHTAEMNIDMRYLSMLSSTIDDKREMIGE